MPKIYLSPSTQEKNKCKICASEESHMNKIVDMMESLLKFNGIDFDRNTPQMTHVTSKNASNKGKYDLHYALHSNAWRGDAAYSIIFYASASGKRMADILARNYKKLYPWEVRINKPTKKYTELFETKAISIIDEIAFHDHTESAKWLHEHMEDIAKNKVQALCEYFGISYKEPVKKIYKKKSIINRTDYPTIKRGSKGSAVEDLQEQLRDMGYLTSSADGIFGPKTEDAVRWLQRINNLNVDGVVGAKTWDNILTVHVFEVDPMCLENKIVASKGTSIKGDFINSIFFDMVEFKPLGNMVNDGQLLAKQRLYNDKGEKHDYVKRGNLIVYQDGSVAVKMIMDIEKEEDLSKIKFAVSGFNMEPLDLKSEWQPIDVGRTTWRSMIGYNPTTDKINAVVMANCSAERGRKVLDKLGCTLKLGLDSSDSTNARFDDKDIRLTGRKLYGILRFE